VVGTDLTKWPDQLDFSAEISKIRNSNAQGVFFFFPGAHGIQCITQYTQAGLKDQIPLYSVFAIDELSIPLLKENGVGVIQTGPWTADLP
ncbi:ABC transporter substrate-binding protein, partial [Acinetobacter baumannii]